MEGDGAKILAALLILCSILLPLALAFDYDDPSNINPFALLFPVDGKTPNRDNNDYRNNDFSSNGDYSGDSSNGDSEARNVSPDNDDDNGSNDYGNSQHEAENAPDNGSNGYGNNRSGATNAPGNGDNGSYDHGNNQPGAGNAPGNSDNFSDDDANNQPGNNDQPGPKQQLKHLNTVPDGLSVGFYKDTCPQAERIVNQVLKRAYRTNPSLAAGIVRLHFHDCLVHGCDASILLDETPSNEEVEKLSPENHNSLKGLELIDDIKAELEKECPGVVSCADALTFATRDALVLSGVTPYQVPGGRRDGLVSRKVDVNGNIPFPDWPVDKMLPIFARKGLILEDLVVLIGAHSIGTAHCFSFSYRVQKADAAAKLDPRLLEDIKFKCSSGEITMPFDSVTEYALDSGFYQQLLNHKGLVEADQMIADDPRSSELMKKLACSTLPTSSDFLLTLFCFACIVRFLTGILQSLSPFSKFSPISIFRFPHLALLCLLLVFLFWSCVVFLNVNK